MNSEEKQAKENDFKTGNMRGNRKRKKNNARLF